MGSMSITDGLEAWHQKPDPNDLAHDVESWRSRLLFSVKGIAVDG